MSFGLGDFCSYSIHTEGKTTLINNVRWDPWGTTDREATDCETTGWETTDWATTDRVTTGLETTNWLTTYFILFVWF